MKIEAKEKEQPVKKIEPKVLRTDSVNNLLEFFYRAETRLTDIVCRKEPIPEVEWCFPQQPLYVLLELLGSRCSKTISRSLDLLLVHTRSSEKKHHETWNFLQETSKFHLIFRRLLSQLEEIGPSFVLKCRLRWDIPFLKEDQYGQKKAYTEVPEM